jgi:hypothetical protein
LNDERYFTTESYIQIRVSTTEIPEEPNINYPLEYSNENHPEEA